MSLLQNSNAIESGGYLIERSLRFQSASSQYLTRTPASAGNRKTWTWSAWVKPSLTVSTYAMLFAAGSTNGASTRNYFGFDSSYRFIFGYGTADYRVSTQVFRDPSSWYHIVVVFDSSNATAQNRIRVYVNNVEITVWTTNNTVTLNQDGAINNNILHYDGAESGGYYFDGYMAEVNFIDGQALTPSSFGETDALTGVWVAKKYTGTYGTNGFYLPFSNGTSTTTLGNDSSGNANNWTLTNFTRSAGTSDCWMYDVPSGNGSPSATQPSSNYAVMNPLKNGGLAFSRANLRVVQASAAWVNARASIQVPSSGKYYLEFISSQNYSVNNVSFVGLCTPSYSLTGSAPDIGSMVNSTTSGEVMALAIDADAKILYYYRNNTNIGNISFSSFTEIDIVVGAYQASGDLNFGQRSFAYTPPSGYKALCTANLPAPTIAKGNQYMDATTYSGNSTIQNVTNAAGFSPDLVWIKNRSGATDHILNDTVRGAGNYLISNLTNAEATNTTIFSAFNSNGFQVNNAAQTNSSGSNYVAWQWDAGSSTVTNTSGTISSQVRANTTAGFSVVTFNAAASGAFTVGHGLGVAPRMIITRYRNIASEWYTYHASVGNTQFLKLNATTAATTSTGIWNNTTPTSTVFTLGSGIAGSTSWTMVAYCFAEIAGFSKFGSYTGNGSTDGVFVYTGFRPKFIMIKRTDAIGSWYTIDTSRAPYNVVNPYLLANSSNAEATDLSWDILSNGFKLRTTYSEINGSGNNMIYMAFAENPFNYSNAR